MSSVDPTLLDIVPRLVRANDVVWDIGANIGLFSFAAARVAGAGGKIFAFEPDAWLVQLLRRSSALQDAAGAEVTVVPIAVASTVSLRSFGIARRSRSSNALIGYGQSQTGGFRERQIVPTFNLDRLLKELPAPDVIKCDTEGAELEVFDGQREMLERVRPVIISEVAGETSGRLSRIFREHRYALFDAERFPGSPSQLEEAPWNTAAIPMEKLQCYVRS
jgi:FkbM family methyltransferase